MQILPILVLCISAVYGLRPIRQFDPTTEKELELDNSVFSDSDNQTPSPLPQLQFPEHKTSTGCFPNIPAAGQDGEQIRNNDIDAEPVAVTSPPEPLSDPIPPQFNPRQSYAPQRPFHHGGFGPQVQPYGPPQPFNHFGPHPQPQPFNSFQSPPQPFNGFPSPQPFNHFGPHPQPFNGFPSQPFNSFPAPPQPFNGFPSPQPFNSFGYPQRNFFPFNRPTPFSPFQRYTYPGQRNHGQNMVIVKLLQPIILPVAKPMFPEGGELSPDDVDSERYTGLKGHKRFGRPEKFRVQRPFRENTFGPYKLSGEENIHVTVKLH